jgi:hypothetical protein
LALCWPGPNVLEASAPHNPVEEDKRTILHGNTYPLARAEFDHGAAPPNLPMARMQLVLRRSSEQEVSLSTTLTFTVMNGLSGTFTLMPQSAGLPAETSCSVSPTSITLNSNNTTVTATLTISTTSSSAASPLVQNWPFVVRPGTMIAFSLLAFPLVFTPVRKRRRIQLAVSLVAFAFLLTIASYGGGGGSSGGGGGGNSGTPVGLDSSATVSFTLGTVSQSAPFSINVE